MGANGTGDFSPNDTCPPPERDPVRNFAALVFGIFLILFIISGNLLVCLSVCTEKALKTTTNYFIVSLAVADLLLAILVLPLYVYSEFQGGVWSLSMVLCDALMTMDVMLCTASIFNLCAISVDRFIAVSIPLNYNRRQIDLRQLILLSTTWIFAFAVASPVIFGLNNVPNRNPSLCRLEDQNYIVYSSICSFFIPCPVMLVLYCGMFQGLRRWEEARKAKLKSSIYLGNRRLYCPPPVIERNQEDIKAEELNLYACSDCSFPRDYKNNGIQTVSYPHIKYAPNGGLRRKPAKINGRERKAMKVLPVVVELSVTPVSFPAK
ncbi:D(4) dopamine receptor isoform X2 [Python bivittatus]|uniref:D(4) dopamine receptor isoform X2 n=1 Tax=Python bivittatus TaxID=176946 RepID=A0A9F5IVT4_PYTBI|nr:D(4) dopamine receptor isoform X2 [Python bivittatus]